MYAAVVNKNIYLYIHTQEEALDTYWLAADNCASSAVEPAPRRTHQMGHKDPYDKVAETLLHSTDTGTRFHYFEN